jgi:hypothetical protein
MSLTQNGTSGHSRGDSTAATVGGKFAVDSPLEEAVTSEPVSDIRLPGIGADSRVIMGDSGSPKRCFAPRNGPKLNRLQF